MALPVAAVVLTPTSGAQSASVPDVTVAASSATSTGDPVITARSWSVGGVADVADTETVDVNFVAPGVYAVAVAVTNADGSNTATANATITDGYVAPDEAWSPRAELATRIHPNDLPAEYQDGLTCTPGLPTSQGIALARTFGTVFPAGDRPTAVVNGVPVEAVANA